MKSKAERAVRRETKEVIQMPLRNDRETDTNKRAARDALRLEIRHAPAEYEKVARAIDFWLNADHSMEDW